jgi:hypothetical protein
MRELDEEERATLRLLEEDLATADLIHMADGLAEVLRGRGHVIQARLVEVMAERLDILDGR